MSHGLTEQELRRLLEEHNRRALCWALGLGAGSAFLWLLSYALTAMFVLLLLFMLTRYPHGWLVHSVTGGVMLVLVIDGIRYTGELFDLDRFRNSFYSIGANQLHVHIGASGVSVTRGNPLQAAFVITQLLLCAPRCTLAALRHFRSRTRIDDASVRDAVECFQRLARMRDWAPVVGFGAMAPALRHLDLTELLWTRVEQGQAQVKLDPSARTRYLEPQPVG